MERNVEKLLICNALYLQNIETVQAGQEGRLWWAEEETTWDWSVNSNCGNSTGFTTLSLGQRFKRLVKNHHKPQG